MCSASASGGPLRIEVDRRAGAVVIQLTGSANMDVSEDLQDRLCGLVGTDAGQVIIDLSGLEFISSVGLGAIVAAHLRCRHHDCQLKLAAPPPSIMELLDVTRLTKLFPVYDSIETALGAAS